MTSHQETDASKTAMVELIAWMLSVDAYNPHRGSLTIERVNNWARKIAPVFCDRLRCERSGGWLRFLRQYPGVLRVFRYRQGSSWRVSLATLAEGTCGERDAALLSLVTNVCCETSFDVHTSVVEDEQRRLVRRMVCTPPQCPTTKRMCGIDPGAHR